MSPGLPSPPFCRKFTCKARWENWTRQTCRQTSTRSTSSKKIRGPEKSTSSPQGDEEEQWQRQDRKGRCSSVACSALCLKLLLCCCLLSRNFDVALEALNNHSVGDGAVGLFHRDGLDRLQSLLCCGGAGQSHFEDRRELNLKFPCLEASSHLNLANSCGNWLDKTMSDQFDFFLQAEAETVSERKGIKKTNRAQRALVAPASNLSVTELTSIPITSANPLIIASVKVALSMMSAGSSTVSVKVTSITVNSSVVSTVVVGSTDVVVASPPWIRGSLELVSG